MYFYPTIVYNRNISLTILAILRLEDKTWANKDIFFDCVLYLFIF